MSQIINRHFCIINNSPFLHNIFRNGSILVANKCCQNLKDLLVRGNRYKIKHNLTDIIPHQCRPCGKKKDSRDSFDASQSYVISNATGRKYYIRRDSPYSTSNVVYMAYCKKCKKFSPEFHGNQDYVTIKVISRRMLVLARLQHILLMNVVMRK